MITHTDATIAKSLLLQFQNYLKAFLQSGPTCAFWENCHA